MSGALHWIAGIFGLLLPVARTIRMKPLKIDWFCGRVYAGCAPEAPEPMSSLRMLPPWLGWYSDDLADASPARPERLARQRVHAEVAAGDEYGIGRFHDLMLTGGSIPMMLLEQRADAWIAGERLR